MESGELRDKAKELHRDLAVSEYRETKAGKIFQTINSFYIGGGSTRHLCNTTRELTGILEVVEIEHRQEHLEIIKKLIQKTR
jgi:hypothetical protein